MSFTFEKLEVYNRSLSFVRKVEVLCYDLKGKVSYSILDQLIRASLSIPLNIAEGNGRWHKKEKMNFLWIARGSAFESVPILRILHTSGHISESTFTDCYKDLTSISMMLANLIKAVDKIDQNGQARFESRKSRENSALQNFQPPSSNG